MYYVNYTEVINLPVCATECHYTEVYINLYAYNYEYICVTPTRVYVQNEKGYI